MWKSEYPRLSMKLISMHKIALMLWALLITNMLTAQTILDTTVKLALKEGTIKEALLHIEQSTDIKFIYDNEKIDVNRKAVISKDSNTVRGHLDLLFGSDMVQYIIRNDKIILKKKLSFGKPSQKKATINGYIMENSSGENLIGATVFDHNSGLGSTSNYYGYYSLTLPVGEVTLDYSYVSAQKRQFIFYLAKDTTINIGLGFNKLLEEVVVSADKQVAVQETTEMGTISLTRKQLQTRPAIGGEVDVIKVLQLLPGVQAGNEGSAGFYVRGGGPDQNLILLDGVPVYNTSHLFGFVSVFNSDAINNIKLIKGAFPARYGGRLSSVVEMSMKEGNMKRLRGSGNVGLIASSLTLEGPIVKDKTSFMVSGRRTYLDLIAKPFTDDGYNFFDVNVKINHRFSDRSRVYFSSYMGRDKGFLADSQKKIEDGGTSNPTYTENETESRVKWGNSISLLRWNYVITPKLFSNLSLTRSSYDFEAFDVFFQETKNDFDTLTEFQYFETSSNIRDLGMKLDFDFFPHPDHYVRFGLQAIDHNFKPNVVGVLSNERVDTSFNASDITAREYSFYVEDDFKLSPKLKANLGIHLSGFDVNSRFYRSFQPRASLRYLFNKDFSVKASYSRMAQFLHLLTNPGLGLPTDLWVPATDRIAPQESSQYSLEFAYSFPELGLEATIEGYYKELDNLIEYKEGANLLRLNEDWQDKVVSGHGESYGVELFFRRNWDNMEGWLGYTLAWANRTFEEINFGNSFPYRYDRRHDVKLAITRHLRTNIQASANWVYGTGIALTLPFAQYMGPTGLVGRTGSQNMVLYDFGARNAFRQRASHRLDIGISFVKDKKWGKRTWLVTIYNVYSRRNPLFIETRPVMAITNEKPVTHFRERTLFPIVPSVTYLFEF